MNPRATPVPAVHREGPAQRVRLLLVDDEPAIRLGLRRFLTAKSFEVTEAEDCAAAERACSSSPPDVAVLDHRLPDGEGVALIRRLRELCPGLIVVMLTAHGSIDLAVRAIKEGADQFLTKPVDLEALLVLVERMLDDRRNRKRHLAEAASESRPLDPFLGTSAAIARLAHEARLVLEAEGPVLVLGETGTGKGVLARWLHDNGPRRAEAFVDLNCAALTTELLESELFGYEAGAFTGASRRKSGLLEVAHRGTVFLDEIGDMDVSIQARVLKVLEEKRFRRLGDLRDRMVDVRLVAATHQDLERLMRDRAFRQDLYFRVAAFPLSVPALRERHEDLPALAHEILGRLARRHGEAPELSPSALDALQSHAWPGNIRELRNVLERAVLRAGTGRPIGPDDLGLSGGTADPSEPGAEGLTLEEVERRHVERILALEGGHVARAARRLGVATSSLYERLKRYGIPSPQRRH